jgi:hypothetical protein
MKRCLITKEIVTLEITGDDESWSGKIYKVYPREQVSNDDLKKTKDMGYKLIYNDPPSFHFLENRFTNN